MSTANMIYPDKKVANLILGKMQKLHPTAGWEVKDQHDGFAVRSKLSLAGALKSATASVEAFGSEVKTGAEQFKEGLEKAAAAKKALKFAETYGAAPAKVGLTIAKAPHLPMNEFLMKVASAANAVNLTFDLLDHTKAWIRVLWNGKMYSLGLPLLMAYHILPDQKVMILMSNEYAKKRGFLK